MKEVLGTSSGRAMRVFLDCVARQLVTVVTQNEYATITASLMECPNFKVYTVCTGVRP